MDPLAGFKKILTVNTKMLPMKLHYLFYAFAISAATSFFPIMIKNIGLSTIAVGVVYTISPFATGLANPLFGWMTDRLQRVKLVLLVMITIQTILFFSTVFVPSLNTDTVYFPVELSCSPNNTYVITSSKFLNSGSLKCHSSCTECLQLVTKPFDDVTLCAKNFKLETESVYNISHHPIVVTNISAKGALLSPNCYKNASNKCKTVCAFDTGIEMNKNNDFASFQFWTLLFLMVPALVLVNSTLAIGDAACYEALEGKVNQFGKNRVWLSIGWGIGTLFTGYFLDLTNPNEDEKVDFIYCAYVMLVLMILDVIALSRAKLTKPEPSKNIFKDICKIFGRPHPIFFAIAALFIGSLSGIQCYYIFWYLEDMGASKLLLGLSIAVLSVLFETPIMFVSGWIVKRIGRDNTLVFTFLSLAAWFISISYIQNPWWVLLINVSRGPIYGLFYVAMTSYGKLATAPGTEATMQTVLGGIFHGLGIGSGSLLGGLGFDLYGGRITYRFSGYVAVSVAIIYKFVTLFVAGEHTAICRGEIEMAETVPDKKVAKHEIYTVS